MKLCLLFLEVTGQPQTGRSVTTPTTQPRPPKQRLLDSYFKRLQSPHLNSVISHSKAQFRQHQQSYWPWKWERILKLYRKNFENKGILPANIPWIHPSWPVALSYGNPISWCLCLISSDLGAAQWLCSFSPMFIHCFAKGRNRQWVYIALLECQSCFIFQPIFIYPKLLLYWYFRQVLKSVTTSGLLKFPSDFNNIHGHSLSVQHSDNVRLWLGLGPIKPS